jgi:hypothetical protein
LCFGKIAYDLVVIACLQSDFECAPVKNSGSFWDPCNLNSHVGEKESTNQKADINKTI